MASSQTFSETGVPRALEWGAYLFVAIIAVLPALLSGSAVVGDGVDLYGTLWFYWWIQDCLVHLHNPGFTDLFFYPLGKDIFAHTGDNFLDALVALPFRALLGFPRYQPVFVAFVLLGNALTFRVLARRVLNGAHGRSLPSSPLLREILAGPRLPVSAFAAVLLWQSCSYTLFEITCGRLTQAFLWFLPLAMERFLVLGTSAARRRDVVLTGVFMALQAWTYWFMGHFMLLLMCWLGSLQFLRTPFRGRLLLRYAMAALCALLLVAPALLPMMAAAHDGNLVGLGASTGSLLELPATPGNNVSDTLHGYWLMERWGAPMLGYCTWMGGILLALFLGRDRLTWMGGAALMLLFALGPAVPLSDGNTISNLPYILSWHLVPFLSRLWFPYRLVVMAFLCLSLAIALALDKLFRILGNAKNGRLSRAGRGPVPLAVVLALLALNLFEQHRQLEWPFVTRDFSVPETFRWIGREGGAIIHLPIGINQPSIVWQTIHHQPMFGGMGENARLLWPEGYKKRLKRQPIYFFRKVIYHPDIPAPRNSSIGLNSLLDEGYRWVVLHRELVDTVGRRLLDSDPDKRDFADTLPFKVTNRLMEVLGSPSATEGPLVVWDLYGEARPPAKLLPTKESLETRTWKPENEPAYEKLLKSKGRLPEGGVPTIRDHHPGGPGSSSGCHGG